MYRKGLFAPGEYFHLLGRGNNKQDIFLDERDHVRFLFLILHLQFSKKSINIGRYVSHYLNHNEFKASSSGLEEGNDVNCDRGVELVAFSLMPNHFHLVVKEEVDGGISKYMQRILNAFTKYHNMRYAKSGHLFQGPFKAVHVQTNEQLLYLSAYVHRNPRELKGWRDNEQNYPWSSYQDYITANRWGYYLSPQVVLDQFSDLKGYRRFVDTSGAKSDEAEVFLD